MPRLNAKNNAMTILTSNIGSSDVIIPVESVATLPSPPFRITIGNEIIEVGEISENNLTSIIRGVEGTTATNHGVGARVENRFTSGTYQELSDNSHNITLSTTQPDAGWWLEEI